MLEGRRILLVEDEYVLARELGRELLRAGAVVIGPEPSVPRALLRLDAEARIDAAVLDVNLRGEMVFPVAEALVRRRVPFLFASGYADEAIGERFPEAIRCEKPYDLPLLLRALGGMAAPG